MFRRFRRACGRLRFRCPAACRRFRGMGCMFCAMGCMFRRPEPGFRVPGAAGVRGACFFCCPFSAVCQPFAFFRKNIFKKSAKKFGPYGEVVVPLHPISGKKIPRSREIFGSFTWNNDRSTGRARPSLASFFGARGEEAFAPWT